MENNTLREWTLFLRDICIILAVVLIIRSYVVAPFRISGSSMEESYHNDEFILVDKFSYADFGFKRVGDPLRWDVVVAQPHAQNGRQYYIKRVIGTPGDTIRIKDGVVQIKTAWASEFTSLNETYLSAANFGKTFPGKSSGDALFEVPSGHYFLLGDNRNGSADSRDCFFSCGTADSSHFIKREDIVGKLWMTLGALKIFNTFSILPEFKIQLASPIGFEVAPRFLESPRQWQYSELSK